MALYTIFYKSDDATGQSQAAAYAAKLKYPTATLTDTVGMSNANIDTAVAAVGSGTQTEIIITIPLVSSHAEGQPTFEQAHDLIPMLITANQVNVANVTGTAQSNSTVTVIKVASGDTGEDDEYNNMLISTSGTTSIFRLITDFVKSTKLATVATTGTAITNETYIIFTTTHLHILGTAISSKKPALLSWENFFPNQTKVPLIISFLGENSIYHKNRVTADSVAAGILTDSSQFSSGAYDDLDYHVAVITATTGAGQIVKIASNTANVLTLAHNWDITPTGTIIYQIVRRNVMVLWNIYLAYAIATYLWDNDAATFAIWRKLMDEYGDLYGYTGSTPKEIYQDLSLLEEYVEKGKHIMDSVNQNVLS